MPKITNRTRKIPKFIRKLNQILQDKQYEHLIAWLPKNNGFQIFSVSKFVDQVLPNYFKHKNMASFVRQLNMYGFNRPKHFQQHAYIHPKFIRGNLNSLRQIQRKVGENKQSQSQESASPQQIQQDVKPENNHLHQLCMKLLNQNKKLRLQNQALSQKIYSLTTVPSVQSSILLGQQPQFTAFQPNIYKNYLKFLESSNNEQTVVDKSSDQDEKQKDRCKQMDMLNQLDHSRQKQNQKQKQKQKERESNAKQGFCFGENHGDWSSRISYMQLIDGARQMNSSN